MFWYAHYATHCIMAAYKIVFVKSGFIAMHLTNHKILWLFCYPIEFKHFQLWLDALEKKYNLLITFLS